MIERSRSFQVRSPDASAAPRADRIAVEEPLEVRIGKTPVLVTMRTPGHDEELVAGLLLTEGVVREPHDIVSVKHCTAANAGSQGNVVTVDLEYGVEPDLEPVHRGFHATTSCGLCGKTSIEQLQRAVPPIPDGFAIDTATLVRLPALLRDNQNIFELTGGTHAAGLFDRCGKVLCVREDVGRHNAVDKVIGWSGLSGSLPLAECVLIVSGRTSFEIVHKALWARIPIVAAVSAATSLAIDAAAAGNQTLVGFLRDPSLTVYCGAERLATTNGGM